LNWSPWTEPKRGIAALFFIGRIGRAKGSGTRRGANIRAGRSPQLEHFQEKRDPVFRPKMRQNKELEPHLAVDAAVVAREIMRLLNT
jgi:hypothetical protein